MERNKKPSLAQTAHTGLISKEEIVRSFDNLLASLT
jgi:hypothetical protein